MSISTSGGRRVLLEGHNLVLPSGTGIATYARQLTERLRHLGYDTEVLVGTARALDPKDPVLSEIGLFDAVRKPNLGQVIAAEWRRLAVSPFAAKPVRIGRTGAVLGAGAEQLGAFSATYALPHLIDHERWHFRRYGRRLRLRMDDPPILFHTTRPAPLVIPGAVNVYTIHDLVPLRLPYTTADDKRFHLGMIRDLCRHADHIVTVSEFSRQDIIRFTGIDESRITNTYQAVTLPEHLLARPASEVARDLEALFGLDYGGYFLFVGALEPKKNLSRIIDAYAASGVQRPLIVAGGLGWMYETDLEKIESEQFLTYEMTGNRIRPRRSVRRLSYLPFDHLVSLLRGARALLFPSLYEGFGLPVLEAMTAGTPVMTSNISSLPEIAADAALLVDPYDVDAMARAIRRLDADEDQCADLAARGLARAREFSPERYEARLDRLYRHLLS